MLPDMFMSMVVNEAKVIRFIVFIGRSFLYSFYRVMFRHYMEVLRIQNGSSDQLFKKYRRSVNI